MSDLVIHALSVGNGILALSGLPGVGGNYASDIDHLREWKPGLVISLTTETEMIACNAAALGNDIQSGGSRWAHLPIDNFGAPPADTLAFWPAARNAAIATLNGGGRVLVHCHGGCGRSGMIALRLMIEIGEAPQKAFTRLRAVRDCAIETEAQMLWSTDAKNQSEEIKPLEKSDYPAFHPHIREE